VIISLVGIQLNFINNQIYVDHAVNNRFQLSGILTMAAASLLALIDDIASILDDVAVMTKVAAKKTAGVLGDDLALNAQQVSGINADRELPVVWAVAKGSALNKLILVPTALAISAFAPWAVTPLLMAGGLFLCYEGVEKLYHQLLMPTADKTAAAKPVSETSNISEAGKIKGAIRTDFVLSAEIIVITLGTVATASFSKQIIVLAGIAAIMTVGVYGLVAAIVKLDDGGLYLAETSGTGIGAQLKRKLGFAILGFAPYMMKALSVVGTAAMFLVGGAILTHGLSSVHHWITDFASTLANSFLQLAVPVLLDGLFGIVAGSVALLLVSSGRYLLKHKQAS
jgi:predicted DNA repair protein MutK